MKKNLKAFSLIELSIAVLIVGIIIAGVTQSSRLVREFKLSSARNLTNSSPVAGIQNLVAWFDASAENVLTNTNGVKNVSGGDSIQNWVEINPQQTNPLNFANSTAGTYPIYLQSGINGLPTLSFDGVDDFMEVASDPRINDLDNFSIFAVLSVNTNANSAGNPQGIITKLHGPSYITGTSSGNPAYALLFNSGTTLQGFAVDDSANVILTRPAYNISGMLTPVSLVTTLTHNATNYTSSSAYNIYVNGIVGTSVFGSPSILHTNTSLKIGQQKNGFPTRFSTCYISEIIFFNRVLITEERKAVEQYLGKKWNIKIS